MTDQSPAPDTGPGIADTAKKLTNQVIDVTESVGQLAVDIPKDSAKVLLAEAKKLVSKIEDVLK